MPTANKIFRRLAMLISQLRLNRWDKEIKFVKLDNFNMIVLANEDVGRQLMLFKTYEQAETNFFKKNIKSTDVCFDIGGNIGYFSLLFAYLAPKGCVHVFEPIKLNYSIINTNVEINSMENLIVNNTAVGSSRGFINFSISEDSAYSSIKNTGRIPELKSISVPLTTIDDYVKLNRIKRIDVLKIDVEGAEELVLDGFVKVLTSSTKKPRFILMELYNGNLKVFNTNIKNVIKKMQIFNYHPFVINSKNSDLIRFDPVIHEKFYNIIFKQNSLRI